MGLDMSLTAKRRISGNLANLHSSLDERFPEIKHREIQGLTIEVEAMYWRKVNSIHRWFVTNVQNGQDDCNTYPVSLEQLMDLHQLVLAALRTRNHEMLPPMSGFFFGSTEVDEGYWSDLQNTADALTRILDEFRSGWEFEYQSSW